jgi:hypothetical protein
MNADLRKRLETQQEASVAKTAERLLSGDDTRDLQPDLERIAVCAKLLSIMPAPHPHRWFWPGGVAFVCVVVAGALWSVKVPNTNVSLSADTDSVRTILREPLRVENAFSTSRIHVERLSSIRCPNLKLSIAQPSGDAWFELRGGRIDVELLEISKDGAIELSVSHDDLNLYASRARLIGRIAVTGQVVVTAGSTMGTRSLARSFLIDIPETVDFAIEIPQSVPSRLSVQAPEPWSLGRQKLTELSFAHEEIRGAGESSLVSGMKNGVLRFDDTAWTPLQLREGDFLTMRPTAIAQLEAHGAKGMIHLNVHGTVSNIRIGDPETSRELGPSYLEYLYNKKSVSLFWGAIVFLWGLIWSTRTVVLS